MTDQLCNCAGHFLNQLHGNSNDRSAQFLSHLTPTPTTLVTSPRHSERSPTSYRSPALTAPVKFVMVTLRLHWLHRTSDSTFLLTSAGILAQSSAALGANLGMDSMGMGSSLVSI